MCNENDYEYKFQAFHKTMRRFYNLKQNRTLINADYLKKLENIWELAKTAGGELGNGPGLIWYSLCLQDNTVLEFVDADLIEIQEAKTDAINRFVPICYIQPSERHRYGKLLKI